MAPVLASMLVATFLLAAAALKLADRTASAVALSTYGLHGRGARAAVWVLAAWEAAIAGGMLAGGRPAVWAGAATLALFALLQAGLLAAGRGGMPCGCLGGTGRLSPASVVRAGVLAAAAAWAALADGGAAAPALVVLACAAALAAVRTLGVRAPHGALEIAGEGPPVGEPTALVDWLPPPDGRVRLAVFTSARCRICRELGPALERLAAEDAVVLRTYEEEREREVWSAVDVPGAPFAVAVGPDGAVLAKGTVNSERQLHSVVAAAHARARMPATSAPSAHDSRRGFLARAATAAGALTVAPSVASLVRPGEAGAYHFCGHIYTTDSCPHPTGLPRIDSRGGALRARDGRPVDDLGRLVDGEGFAVDEAGRRLSDPDGRALPLAPRTEVCRQVARRYRIGTRVDGAWYRCCGGQVRKLVDCCTTSDRRINGDRALRGYCYEGRKVFCVLYYDTRVPC